MRYAPSIFSTNIYLPYLRIKDDIASSISRDHGHFIFGQAQAPIRSLGVIIGEVWISA